MRAAIMYGPGDVGLEERDEPRIVESTDAIIRVSAAYVYGSDLWPYRGIGVNDDAWPMPRRIPERLRHPRPDGALGAQAELLRVPPPTAPSSPPPTYSPLT
jgi:hypothetical protein